MTDRRLRSTTFSTCGLPVSHLDPANDNYYTFSSDGPQLTWLIAMMALFVMMVNVSFDYGCMVSERLLESLSTVTDHVSHIIPQDERALQ